MPRSTVLGTGTGTLFRCSLRLGCARSRFEELLLCSLGLGFCLRVSCGHFPDQALRFLPKLCHMSINFRFTGPLTCFT